MTTGDEDSLSLRDLGLVLVMNAAWGGNFVVSKFAVTELPPLFSVAIRFALVTLICLPWLKPFYGRMGFIIRFGLMMGFLHFGLLFVALEMTDKVSGMAIIAQLGVPIAVVMAVVMLKERIGWKRVAGIALSFLGAMVLGFDPVIFNDLDAISVMLVTVIIACYGAILMRNMRGIKPLELQAWTGAVSFIPLGIVSLIFERDSYHMIADAGVLAWVAVAYSAVAASIVAHAINFYLLQRYPVSFVAPYSLLAPIIGVVLAMLFLGDKMTVEFAIGGTITLIGVAIVTLRGSKRPKNQTA